MTAAAVLILSLLLASSSAIAAEAHFLGDFETDNEAAAWQAPRAARGDCRLATIGRSTEYASHGKASLEVVFTKHEKGMEDYVVLEPTDDNRGLNKTDWTGYDALVADYYSPAREPVPFSGRLRDISRRKSFKFRGVLRPGWNRVRWSIPDMAKEGLDLSQMAELTMAQTKPEHDLVYYLDNVRLVDAKSEQTRLLSERIDAIAAATKQLAAEGKLDRRLADLEAQIKTAEPEQFGKIADELFAAILGEREALTDRVAALADELDLPRPGRFSIVPFLPGEPHAGKLRPRGLGPFAELLTLQLKQQQLQERLSEVRPAHDFAVGHVFEALTSNLRYQPKTFDGPLVDTVQLKAARNEVEPICLLVIPIDEPLRNVVIAPGALMHEQGRGQIASDRMVACPLGYRRATPEEPAYGLVLRHDIDAFDVPVDAQHAIWVNVHVPEDAEPGVYTGALVIAADSVRPRRIGIELRVRSFSIPRIPTLQIVTHYAPRDEQGDGMVMAHRCNASGIYEWPHVPDVAVLRRRIEGGTRMHTMFRISRMHRQYERDAHGKIVSFRRKIREGYLNRLGAAVPTLKEAGLLKYCYVYGFDEPTSSMVPAMEDMFGAIKEEFELATFFTTYLPIWEDHPVIKHVDHYGVVGRWLTPERMEAIRAQGSKVWKYNMHSRTGATRAQYWQAFKCGVDGLLQYSLHAGGGLAKSPAFPMETGPVGGLCYPVTKDGPAMATVAFEQWREGSEDYEYLVLIREAVERIVKTEGEDGPHRYDVIEACRWLSVPESIASPYHDPNPPDPPSLERLLSIRSQIGDLIERLGALAQ